MHPKQHANRIMLSTLIILIAVSVALVFWLDDRAFFIIFPLVLITNAIIYFKITGIKCPNCHKPYGLRPNKYSWLIVPQECVACKQKPQ